MCMRHVCLFLVVSFATAICFGEIQTDSNTGSISGQVLDESQQAVKAVLVQAANVGSSAAASLAKPTYTDQSGYFTIRGLSFGQYFLFYEKPVDDYPRNDFSFYSGGKTVSVELTATHPNASVSINLGPKGARLLSRIIDQATGAPVRGARLLLKRSDNPNFWVSEGVNSGFSLLVPSGVSFTVTITAEGYESVPYGAPPGVDTPASMKLEPESSRTIMARMKRIRTRPQ
jgi:hypothetical protein